MIILTQAVVCHEVGLLSTVQCSVVPLDNQCTATLITIICWWVWFHVMVNKLIFGSIYLIIVIIMDALGL